ncbi:hypothetical protein NEOLI_004217, partial [Neolecta irregularis DAH-3]
KVRTFANRQKSNVIDIGQDFRRGNLDRSSQSSHSWDASKAEIYEKAFTVSTRSYSRHVFRPAFPDPGDICIQTLVCGKPIAAYFTKDVPSIAFFRNTISLQPTTQSASESLLITHITRNADLYAIRSRSKIINFSHQKLKNLMSVSLRLSHLALGLYTIASPRTFVMHHSILQLTGRFDVRWLSKLVDQTFDAESLQSRIDRLLVTALPQDLRVTKYEGYVLSVSVCPPERGQILSPVLQLEIPEKKTKCSVPLQSFTTVTKRISFDGKNDILPPIITSHHILHEEIYKRASPEIVSPGLSENIAQLEDSTLVNDWEYTTLQSTCAQADNIKILQKPDRCLSLIEPCTSPSSKEILLREIGSCEIKLKKARRRPFIFQLDETLTRKTPNEILPNPNVESDVEHKTSALVAELKAKFESERRWASQRKSLCANLKKERENSLQTESATSSLKVARVRFSDKTSERVPCRGLYLMKPSDGLHLLTTSCKHRMTGRKSVKSLISQFELVGGNIPIVEGEPKIFYFDTILFG